MTEKGKEHEVVQTWRTMRVDESRRPPERDIEITGVDTMIIEGNFPWPLTKVATDTGLSGLGEIHTHDGAPEAAEQMARYIEGENPLDIDRILSILDQNFAGGGTGRCAVSGIEMALWDIKGKLLDVPLYELLGGKYRDSARIYCDTHAGGSYSDATGGGPRDLRDYYSPESYASAARSVVDDGFDALKFDLDVPIRRGEDTAARRMDNKAIEHKVSVVEAVREEIGYGVDLGMDLHGAFTVETATRLGDKLEPFDLAWIEDPIPTTKTVAHRRVTDQLRSPILAGEQITNIGEFNEFVRSGAIDIAAPDVTAFGGLWQLRKVADICDLYGVPMAFHNTSSPIGTAAAVHLCAAIPNFVCMEFHSRDVSWWNDLANRTGSTNSIMEDGYIDLPKGPGIGVELDAEVATEHLAEGSEMIFG